MKRQFYRYAKADGETTLSAYENYAEMDAYYRDVIDPEPHSLEQLAAEAPVTLRDRWEALKERLFGAR